MNDSGPSCILAVDAGGTFLKAALVKPDYTIIADTFLKIQVDSDGELEGIKESYIKLASSGARIAAERGLELLGIGVCIPGPFDYTNGICLMKHKYLSVYGISLHPWFQEGAGNIPVRFVHDSTAFILGATEKEQYQSFKKICGVIIGTGLGFATMLDGKVINNPHGGPGISIYSRSYRNKKAEDYVSRRAIIANYKLLCPEAESNIDVIDIAKLARKGCIEAIKVFNDTGLYLSEILHDIIKENNFECLLLGGAISKSADLYIPSLRQGLSDLSDLALISQADDIDNTPIIGVAKALSL